jgi:hypothetical protein
MAPDRQPLKILPPLVDTVAPVVEAVLAGAPTDPVEAEESDGLGVPADGVPFASMPPDCWPEALCCVASPAVWLLPAMAPVELPVEAEGVTEL